MLDRLGLPGIAVALLAVACVGAAVLQGSTVAIIVAVPAILYVAVRLLRTGDA